MYHVEINFNLNGYGMFCKEKNWQTNYNSQWNSGFQKPNLITKKAIQPFIFRGCPKTFSKRHIVLIQNGRMVLLGPSFLRLKLNMRLDFLF